MTMNAIMIAIGVVPPAIPTPTFLAPLSDAGAGAVNLTLGNGAGSATFTRATTAWAKLASGLWAQVNSGVARAHYLGADTTVGAYGGYLAEEARTNLCLQSRDLSNASWTKTSATAAKDQVGIDGSANSASSLTATAGGGSCVQTITQAATNAALSFFIKRITGTGTITLQQGATTLDVTASINSSTYTRVELDAAVLNPSIGIVLGTNGDKIAVDMAQFENGAFATSPIPTTTTSVARNVDVLSYPTSGNILPNLLSASAEIATEANGTNFQMIVDASSGGHGAVMYLEQSTNKLSSFGAGVGLAGTAIPQPITSVTKVAMVSSAAGTATYVNGAGKSSNAIAANYTLDANMSPGIRLPTSFAINGTIRNLRVWKTALTDAQIAAL